MCSRASGSYRPVQLRGGVQAHDCVVGVPDLWRAWPLAEGDLLLWSQRYIEHGWARETNWTDMRKYRKRFQDGAASWRRSGSQPGRPPAGTSAPRVSSTTDGSMKGHLLGGWPFPSSDSPCYCRESAKNRNRRILQDRGDRLMRTPGG
jgi:hypothetical protein